MMSKIPFNQPTNQSIPYFTMFDTLFSQIREFVLWVARGFRPSSRYEEVSAYDELPDAPEEALVSGRAD
jgi:hypothetical protein